MAPILRPLGSICDKIEAHRAAFVFHEPLEEGLFCGSPVVNEVVLGTDVKIRPPPGGASSLKSLMFVL
jgi:hypothetical protein